MIDVLLICALKDEYDQVLEVKKKLLDPGWKEQNGPRRWKVSDGRFEVKDGEPLHIRTSWATHMGREQAQATASMLIHDHPARCLAMSGICAGRRDKVALGDVIFGDRLWSYDAGKSTLSEDRTRHFQGDPLQFRPPTPWVQRMQSLKISPTEPWLLERPALPLEHQEAWLLARLLNGDDPPKCPDFKEACPEWSSTLERLWKRKWLIKDQLVLSETGRAQAEKQKLLYPSGLPAPPAFQTHVAPLATGAEVTEDEGVFSRLSETMRKVLGVEMEASALGALGDTLDIPVLVAKGVSDFGDAWKDDRYRHFAARAAAECLIALLCDSVDLLRPGADKNGTIDLDLPMDLIHALAEAYPDIQDARALWERAGGLSSEVESIQRPRDLWQRLWKQSRQGARARPADLLRAALKDMPGNEVFARYLKALTKSDGQGRF